MKTNINEKGYALVTVLLIITVFSILSLSFASQAFTSTKQNKIVEEKAQAIALAEMGVEYFKAAVENAYVESQPDVKEVIENKIEEDRDLFCFNKNTPCHFTITDEMERDYLELATGEMKVSIENKLTNKLAENKDGIKVTDFGLFEGDSIAKFKIDKGEDYFIKSTFEEVGKIQISFISTGIETDKEKDNFKLHATFTLDIDDLEFGDGSSENSGGNDSGNNEDWNITFPNIDFNNPSNYNTIKRPSNVSDDCKNINQIRYNSACSNILLPSNINDVWTDGSNNMSNKTIYFENNDFVNLRSNTNNLNYVSIHAEGRLQLGSLKNVANTTVESKGDLTVLQNSSLKDNSKIISGNNLTIESPELNNNSSIFVKNNMTVNGNGSNISNSDISIGGALEHRHTLNLNNNSNLYIKSDARVKGAGANLNNNSIMYVDGGLNLENTLNIISSKLYVNSDINIWGSNHNVKDGSVLFIGGNLKGNSGGNKVDNLTVSGNSKIHVKNNAAINNNTNITNDSSIYVGGDFSGANINIGNNSKLCVRGNFTQSWGTSQTSSNSHIFVSGNYKGDDYNKSKITFITDLNKFESICGTSVLDDDTGNNNSTNPNFNWGNIKQDVDYQY